MVADNGTSEYTNGHSHGLNGLSNGLNGYTNGTNGHVNGSLNNGTSSHPEQQNGVPRKPSSPFEPIAICGMACRLPGGVSSPSELWDFLISGSDGRIRTPASRFNIDGYYSATKRAGTTNTEYGYFLDESVDLAGLDTSMFSMSRMEVEWLDPQQRMMLEVARESLDDAGEVNWRGSSTGVYIGSFGQDWYDILQRDGLRHSVVSVIASHDFMISERLSHEMDLKGPSMTLRTACSSALVGLNEACMAIAKGDCTSAIVGGTNLILAPDLVTRLADQGILSPDGSCKTFSAAANGYARGEAIVSIYIKPLSAALRDGNPIRSVITGSASNFDGRTNPLTTPSATAQEALIRRTYEVAGIEDFSRTGLFECHGTGTPTGDPIEVEAITAVFGDKGIHLGAVKPNVGHSEGASGLTAVIKATLALEHRTIPPNIKSFPLNPKIPFEAAQLKIPQEPTAWPSDRDERVSINSFGVGGSNAHVIVESAASFLASHKAGVAPVEEDSEEETEEPQLLVFSANTAQSLKDTVQNYRSLLSNSTTSAPLKLSDLAYTLANRREHLPHRSFAIATGDKLDVPASINPSSTSGSSAAPSLVMVFTGQGAAWPQMSRDLLLTNSTFAHTIKSLNQYLQKTLGATWSIEEELLKPTRTSRVYQAEFSQPLCTALQLALVDTLASVGIKPAAVVGHSSGEIAAAYAAGALTAEEAIAVAFHRGRTTLGQTAQKGGMAAVGLGWEEVQEFLVPGAVAACDNSPSSVTLSGDADKLEAVVAEIKKARPGVSATTLKVEKAYHSHHMLTLGPDYHKAMTTSGVVGKAPQIPFFSSVRGTLLGTTKAESNQLGPKYWQANLEQPVLFKSAVTEILRAKHLKNQTFLELGPHSALAGPLRQILATESSKASYVASLVRRQNSAENLLQVLGKLYTLHAKIDFPALFPQGGAVLPDLPRYAWDHSRRFWFESRVAREWRGRPHADHNLLGARVPESTDLEPVWRNFLHMETTPWVVDHKIGEAIVFPFAGYVSIAGEAARQVSGIEDGVSFREVAVNTALVLEEEAPVEIVTTMRRHRLTDGLNSEWWEFNVSSYKSNVWTKHCSGQVRGESAPETMPESTKELEILPRKVDGQRWYESARKEGLIYGPSFATMDQIRSSTGWPHKATAIMRNNRWGDEGQYHLHPVVLDTWFQVMSCSVSDGIGHAYRRQVASRVDSLTIFRGAGDLLEVSVTSRPTDAGYVGEGAVTCNGRAFLSIQGSHATIFEEADASEEKSTPITARCEWVPHVDLHKNIGDMFKPPQDFETFKPLLAKLVQSAIALASVTAKNIEVRSPHLAKYKEWLISQSDGSIITTTPQDVEAIVRELRGTSAGGVATAIASVSRNIEALLEGKKTGWEILNTDSGLDSLTGFLRTQDDAAFLRCLAHSKPNTSVLEIGAGIGEKTSRIVDSLTRADGQPLYSQYIVADASSGLLNSAKERLKDAANTEFAVLDVSADLAGQGFENRKFDLIIAANVISDSDNVQESLKNLRELLTPHGRLLLEEPRPGLSWAKFALGTLPSWWSHEEDLGRADEVFLSSQRWQEQLTAAGFGEIRHINPGHEDWTNNILVARPHTRKPSGPAKRVTLLSESSADAASSLIVQELEGRGYVIDRFSLGQIASLPRGQDILALLEEEQPFFEAMDESKLTQVRSLLSSLGDNGLIWVTRLSNVGCTDPRYAQAIGLVRALRSETSKDIATLETEKIVTPAGAIALVDILDNFRLREDDGALGPDLEYAIYEGQVLVNRVFPFSLDEDLLVSHASGEAVLTQAHPGRLNTLTWSTKSATAPKDDEVEMEVYASGLNFRDVLVGMQIIPGRHAPRFGYEAAGIVRRVGSNVTKLRPGDHAVVTGSNTFATVFSARDVQFEKLPDNISLVEGACIPTVFVTAVYGLMDLARLSKGQSVLIHSGAGGVGLAAIQVASMLGAEIYTTVGSEKKVQYLMETFDLPRNRIFNSRNTSFVDDLLRETKGKGVDVALNSLSGELLHATWKCIAKWGTMVEIGKRDLLGNARLDMSLFLANRNYCCLDVDQMVSERPELSARILKFTMDCFAKGVFKPIRIDQVFSAPAVLDAFRYMQQGKHIGKIVIEIRDPAGKLLVDNVEATKKAGAELDGAASYLLIGGLGGLGRSMSVWMVQHGAKNLTFLSRSAGKGKHDADFVREIESMGCTVQLVAGDVASPDDVARAVDGTLAPLKGIVQMSMVLRDQMFDGMSAEDWNAVTRPKVQGTWNLHKYTLSRGLNLDFFVLFSSLSGIIGQIGQTNYASANTFLDAFVQYRTGLSLPCTAIDLGAMEGIGYLSENQDLLKKMQGSGWRVVQEVELLGALDLAMMPPSTRTQRKQGGASGDAFLLGIAPTTPLSSPESSARLRRDVRLAIYHNIGAGSNSKAGSASDGLRGLLATYRKDPSLLKSPETTQVLALEIGKKLFSLLLAGDAEVDISMSTADLGLDSLVAIELRAWWKLNFGFEVSTLEMLSIGTLEALGKRAVDGLIVLYEA